MSGTLSQKITRSPEPPEIAAHTLEDTANDPGETCVVLFEGELGSWEKLACPEYLDCGRDRTGMCDPIRQPAALCACSRKTSA